MWMTDMNGTLVNMDEIKCINVEEVFALNGDLYYSLVAYTTYETEFCEEYFFGAFETQEGASEELARLKDKLMSQG